MKKIQISIQLVMLFFLIVFSSCSNTSDLNNDIDQFISKYKNKSFSSFTGMSISYRDFYAGEDIYMFAKQGGHFPPYIVYFNKEKNEVTRIDTKLLKQGNYESYFDDSRIRELMKEFVSFDVPNLSFDSGGNVFIRPFYAEQSPILLRPKAATNEKEIRKGIVYTLYKSNWYISKR